MFCSSNERMAIGIAYAMSDRLLPSIPQSIAISKFSPARKKSSHPSLRHPVCSANRRGDSCLNAATTRFEQAAYLTGGPVGRTPHSHEDGFPRYGPALSDLWRSSSVEAAISSAGRPAPACPRSVITTHEIRSPPAPLSAHPILPARRHPLPRSE